VQLPQSPARAGTLTSGVDEASWGQEVRQGDGQISEWKDLRSRLDLGPTVPISDGDSCCVRVSLGPRHDYQQYLCRLPGR
jgi:hypothetical protein